MSNYDLKVGSKFTKIYADADNRLYNYGNFKVKRSGASWHVIDIRTNQDVKIMYLRRLTEVPKKQINNYKVKYNKDDEFFYIDYGAPLPRVEGILKYICWEIESITDDDERKSFAKDLIKMLEEV